MTLLAAHELGLALACTLALLSVLMGGAMPGPAWGALCVAPVAAVIRLRGGGVAPGVGTIVGSAGMLAAVAIMAQHGVEGSVVAGAVALTGVLDGRLISRQPLLQRSDAPSVGAQDSQQTRRVALSHDMQALLLSLMLVFAGSVLHVEFTYGLVFVLYAMTATWALVTRQLVAGALSYGDRGHAAVVERLLRRRDVATWKFFSATGAVALVILMITSIVFVLFPRIGLGRLGWSLRGSNMLPKQVSLSGIPRAFTGAGEVVARVRGIPYVVFSRGLYLKAQVYDALQQDGFAQSIHLARMPRSELAVVPSLWPVSYEVHLQPVTDDRLVSLGPVSGARVIAGGMSNPSLRVRILGVGPGDELMPTSAITGPLRYTVSGGIAQPGSVMRNGAPRKLRTWVEQHFLALPAQLDPRVVALAEQWTHGATDAAAKADSLRGFLLNHFTYTLTQPNAPADDPLVSFLFDDRRGHCEYFATAFAVLLRAAGVPSRVVGGYQGGRWDDSGDVVVFSGEHAHAWVEWFDSGSGWRVDDATPEVSSPPQKLVGFMALTERLRRIWDDYVFDYGLRDQVGLIKSLASAVSETNNDTRSQMPAGRQTLRFALYLLAAGCVAGVLRGFWRLRTQRRAEAPNPVGKALLLALERLRGEPTPIVSTLRELVVDTLGGKLSDGHTARVTDEAVLWKALEMYEAERFGAYPRDSEARTVIARLARLAPGAVCVSVPSSGPVANGEASQ